MRALCRASHAQGHLPCLRQSDDNVRALNDFDLLQYYYPVAFEFTYEELVARRANSFASSRRNMSYYAASQAMNIKGRANQVAWHPGIKTFFTGAHQDPLDEAGKEIPQDMSAAMIEAWTSEPVPDQAVLIEFAAGLHKATNIAFGNHSALEADTDWEPFTHDQRAAAAAKMRGPEGGGDAAPKKRRAK